MVNRINIFQPDAPMSYDDRIKILKERKLEETRVKSTMKVYQDGDDYGSIPAPETYQFHCIPNHENGSWYGYDGWSKNFYKLMTEHPVYIDPVDAFTCRWMFSMIWFDEKSPDKGLHWNPNFLRDRLGRALRRRLPDRVEPWLGRDLGKAGFLPQKAPRTRRVLRRGGTCGARCAELDLARD